MTDKKRLGQEQSELILWGVLDQLSTAQQLLSPCSLRISLRFFSLTTWLFSGCCPCPSEQALSNQRHLRPSPIQYGRNHVGVNRNTFFGPIHLNLQTTLKTCPNKINKVMGLERISYFFFKKLGGWLGVFRLNRGRMDDFFEYIQSKSSIEESENFSTDMSFSAFLMGEDALVGCEDEVTELSGREDAAGPLFEVSEDDIVPGRDDTALVDSSQKLNDNLLASVVVDDFELTNVVVLLHDSQEFDQDLGGGSEEHLLLSFSLSIDNSSQSISQNVNSNHCGSLIIQYLLFQSIYSSLCLYQQTPKTSSHLSIGRLEDIKAVNISSVVGNELCTIIKAKDILKLVNTVVKVRYSLSQLFG